MSNSGATLGLLVERKLEKVFQSWRTNSGTLTGLMASLVEGQPWSGKNCRAVEQRAEKRSESCSEGRAAPSAGGNPSGEPKPAGSTEKASGQQTECEQENARRLRELGIGTC